MTKNKDLKRVVRARMQKTGESYTAARHHLVRRKEVASDAVRSEPAPDYAAHAGMSDASVKKQTGRDWKDWVAVLDGAKAADKPHGEIAKYVSSLGTPDWWSQMVTVGYERIRGLRERGQRRGGLYEASKSRTFSVSVAKLFDAFAKPRKRARWLPGAEVRSSTANKAMRLVMKDGTVVLLGFTAKGAAKSAVALAHTKLPDKVAIAKVKTFWAERFDALAELVG